MRLIEKLFGVGILDAQDLAPWARVLEHPNIFGGTTVTVDGGIIAQTVFLDGSEFLMSQRGEFLGRVNYDSEGGFHVLDEVGNSVAHGAPNVLGGHDFRSGANILAHSQSNGLGGLDVTTPDGDILSINPEAFGGMGGELVLPDLPELGVGELGGIGGSFDLVQSLPDFETAGLDLDIDFDGFDIDF